MPNFSELPKNLRAFAADIRAGREKEAVTVASDLFAQTKNRILQSGTDSHGARLPGYSEAKVPKFFYAGRSRSAGAESRVKKSREFFIGYEEFRQANNLQTGHVDLSFTGQMWRETNVTVRAGQPGVLVTIEGRTEAAQQKIEWNSARYGESILTPSDLELFMARTAWRERLAKRGKRFGI